jgi:hypothetical protein
MVFLHKWLIILEKMQTLLKILLNNHINKRIENDYSKRLKNLTFISD